MVKAGGMFLRSRQDENALQTVDGGDPRCFIFDIKTMDIVQ